MDAERRSGRYGDYEFFDRSRHERYDYDRDMDFYSQPPPPPPPDEALYRMPRPLLPHPHDPLRDLPPPLPYDEPVPEGAVALGRVVLYPLNPLEPKPKRRVRPQVCKTIFVGSLPDNCMEKHLMDLFAPCGEIMEARVSRGRNFGHVQFTSESSVERAMNLSGCTIRVENSPLPKDCSRIHVDYAQDKGEMELKRRVVGNDMMSYSQSTASNIAADLHKEGVFCYAAKNVANWLNKGDCRQDNANTFFDLITNVNSYGRKLAKYIQNKEEEELEFRVKTQEYYSSLDEESKVILEVYEATTSPKARSSFTKPQRKSIAQWKEQAVDIQERLRHKFESRNNNDASGDGEPPNKMMKVDGSGVSKEELEAKLERALKEIGQLKIDREVAIEKREKQILQLKTLMAKFKKSYPAEWGKSLGVTEKADDSMNLEEKEVIDGVSLDDLNDAMDRNASETSLASAAAAYANIKKSVGSTEVTGQGLSEAEVAIVSVMASFLTVHPLGASIESITAYFQTFNPAYSRIYLESLLHRLAKVFQQSGDGGEKKWWFLGFQTCYATPTSATPTSKDATEASSS